MRIKRPESVIDKIRRLPTKFPTGLDPDILSTMRDVLGARIITFFHAHLRMVDEEIRTGRTPTPLLTSCELPTPDSSSIDAKTRMTQAPPSSAACHRLAEIDPLVAHLEVNNLAELTSTLSLSSGRLSRKEAAAVIAAMLRDADADALIPRAIIQALIPVSSPCPNASTLLLVRGAISTRSMATPSLRSGS